MKDRIPTLIYELTRKRVEVRFSEDFTGMITVGITRRDGTGEHHHCGNPYESEKDMWRAVSNYLAEILEELE